MHWARGTTLIYHETLHTAVRDPMCSYTGSALNDHITLARQRKRAMPFGPSRSDCKYSWSGLTSASRRRRKAPAGNPGDTAIYQMPT